MTTLLVSKIGKESTLFLMKKKKKNQLVRFMALLLSTYLEILPEQAFVLFDNSDLF